ncbi:MAG: hypothetical protein A3G77_01895 [Acidobacteria bacterium RIFCSPLOWO2_12_FULL_68_19]|nr:MAG: hypothetical protein A3G77_01895 [Acidobacteria bacterium RIFCSPLOWO2_12_FULL_68_19]
MPVRIVLVALLAAATAAAQSAFVIREQGARPFGGRITGNAAGGSLHCDHGYVEWQIPEGPRRTPLVMVHASSTKTWDTTFDGREGFRHIFLRRGFPVYLTDLPRTGRAGQGCAPVSYEPQPNHDQAWFTNWRLGLWLPGDPTPDFYPGVQFPQTERALNEFFRIQYPEFNAPENEQVETDALAALLDELGPSVLLTHSSTGIRGWITATKTTRVAAIVSYEPGDAVLPDSEMPSPIERIDGMKLPPGRAIPMADFLKLTKVPIQIVWGDYIPPTMEQVNVGPRLSLDNRRVNVQRAKLMVEAINRHGGDARNVMLPEIGIRGNTHFPMLDLNNVQIADLLSAFLAEKQLDRR